MRVFARSAVVMAVVALVMALPAVAQTTDPVITRLEPNRVVEDSAFTLTIHGANFVAGSTFVRVGNGTSRAATVANATRLTFPVLASEVATAGTLQVRVSIGSRTSAPSTLTVLPNTPRITALEPAQLIAGAAPHVLRVTGENFSPAARVYLNETARTTTFIDAGTLDVQLVDTDMALRGTPHRVEVRNHNNANSPEVQLPVVNNNQVAPEITSLDPERAVAGRSGFVLTINGRNFDPARAQVIVTPPGGVAEERPAVTRTATRITVTILDRMIRTPGNVAIRVANSTSAVSQPFNLIVEAELRPRITRITPTSLTVGTSARTLTIEGTDFEPFAKVYVNGVERQTTVNSVSRVTATLTEADVRVPSELSITVRNPAPDGLESEPRTLFVVAQNAPVINSLNPPSITVGTPDPRVVVNGTGFVLNDIVMLNGVPRETQFLSATQLSVNLLPQDVAAAGEWNVTVFRSQTIVSAPARLQIISEAQPFIESITPNSATAGGAPVEITLTGRNFAPNSRVLVDARALTQVTYVSATVLRATLPASELTPRLAKITVQNGVDGATSAEFDYAIIEIIPEIDELDPQRVTAGEPGFSLNVRGRNFTSTARINLNGVPQEQTRFVSDTLLSLIIPAGTANTPGNILVTVTDRGVTSQARVLQVLAPAVTSVDPGVIAAGSNEVTATVTGSGFLTNSVVSFKGGDRQTTFVSPTQLRVVLPAVALAEVGQFALVVRNTPEAISAPFLLEIVSPGAPRVDALTPSSIVAGTQSFDLRVRGANFLPSSRIRVNGQERETRFISTTELATTLTADDLRNTGTLSIVVVSAAGETSAAATLNVTAQPPAGGRRRSARH